MTYITYFLVFITNPKKVIKSEQKTETYFYFPSTRSTMKTDIHVIFKKDQLWMSQNYKYHLK